MTDQDNRDLPAEGEIPKTSDQLDEEDKKYDAAAQEEDQAEVNAQDGLDEVEEAEGADTTVGGVAGQAGVSNG